VGDRCSAGGDGTDGGAGEVWGVVKRSAKELRPKIRHLTNRLEGIGQSLELLL